MARVNGLLFLERLSDGDLELLAEAAGEVGPPGQRAARLRRRPDRIAPLLGSADVYDALFGPRREEPVVVAAPFLAFSVLLGQSARLLARASFVTERVRTRQRVPVFDVGPLRDFLDDPLRRLFLADLLSSYTHVQSGVLWRRTARGWRHQRFSELDPVRLAELVAAVPEEQRLVLHRRLGDLALFLTGVFPDYVEGRPLSPVAVERLERAVAETPGERVPAGRGPDARAPLERGGLAVMEWLGRRAYERARAAVRPWPDRDAVSVPEEVAVRFRDARRVLNFVTDRFLFSHRERWFPLGS
jgi:hypothetical protein